MADVYRMQAPSVPSDGDLDRLDAAACGQLNSIEVDPKTRKLLRAQRDTIRQLRVALSRTQAERDSIKAIADIARDERVAGRCPGSLQRPAAYGDKLGHWGLCPACNTSMSLNAGRLPVHDVPAVRPS